MKFIQLVIAGAAAVSLAACAAFGDAPASAGSSSTSTGSASVGSTAQDTPAKPDFGNLDANDDQHVSLAEAAANIGVARGFQRADTNRDGKLTREEFRSVD